MGLIWPTSDVQRRSAQGILYIFISYVSHRSRALESAVCKTGKLGLLGGRINNIPLHFTSYVAIPSASSTQA